ncbi:ABC transporter permease [Paenibacillus validus]|uniref:ABC transporter permease subunit n=1 Tax=Paenibacillus validus TaxID=44253 RepID=A0A7X2ZFI8_9BACL|nr:MULTISPECIES: ABC transporter permease [Paenibacillus]MED4602182.1 ABC transporter permease [Paenibacillus validus]MED4609467.1 ABC transporter permease [Paenibacillus validus]MUG73893.1 ABC transporter permease subunit [Paenibacillus validus]
MRQTRLQVPGLLLRAVSVAAFVLLWKWAVDVNIHWPLQFGNLPDPIDILAEWYRNLFTPQYRQDIAISTSRVLTGIALGFTTAVPLGLWIGLKRTANHTLYTNLELFRPIPLIAYLPVAMLLFRTIESSIIFITFIGAFFPILISSRDAARRVSPALVQAARCLGCGPVRAVWSVYLPAMAPEIFTGLSVGIGASWMGVITGEMMSGQTGIGYSTWQAYHLLDYKESIIGMFTIGALGYLSSAFVRTVERFLIRWQ